MVISYVYQYPKCKKKFEKYFIRPHKCFHCKADLCKFELKNIVTNINSNDKVEEIIYHSSSKSSINNHYWKCYNKIMYPKRK